MVIFKAKSLHIICFPLPWKQCFILKGPAYWHNRSKIGHWRRFKIFSRTTTLIQLRGKATSTTLRLILLIKIRDFIISGVEAAVVLQKARKSLDAKEASQLYWNALLYFTFTSIYYECFFKAKNFYNNIINPHSYSCLNWLMLEAERA